MLITYPLSHAQRKRAEYVLAVSYEEPEQELSWPENLKNYLCLSHLTSTLLVCVVIIKDN